MNNFLWVKWIYKVKLIRKNLVFQTHIISIYLTKSKKV